MDNLLPLLREAVAAKIRYWDALRALEQATTDNGDWPDNIGEAVIQDIELLAAFLDEPEDAATRITQQHVTDLLAVISMISPTPL